MLILVSLFAILVGLGSVVCWIIVLTKLFPSEGAGMGILGILCGLYAFIWGWQNKETVGPTIMILWTVFAVIGLVLRVSIMTMGR
jgi:hypothetical protein